MHTDFSVNNRIFGSGKDGVFGYAVLCVGVFCVCGIDVGIVGLFVVVVSNCVGGGECARDVSVASFEGLVGINDGAEGEVCLETNCAFDRAFGDVGSGDDTFDFV